MPPALAALKTAGARVGPMKSGGWSVDFKSAKELTEENWKLLESAPDLTRFSTGGEQFTDADLARLCKIRTIEELFFNGPSITDAGLASLAELPKLRRFGIDHGPKITGTGAVALKGAKVPTALHFGGCMVGDEGAKAIAELSQLRTLELGHVRITRAAFSSIAKMTDLETLLITPNWNVEAYTAADFAALAPLQNLHELEIHDMVLPWEEGLSNLKLLKGLTTLKLHYCYIAEADLEKLKAGLPGVKVDIRNPAGEDRLLKYKGDLERFGKKQKSGAVQH